MPAPTVRRRGRTAATPTPDQIATVRAALSAGVGVQRVSRVVKLSHAVVKKIRDEASIPALPVGKSPSGKPRKPRRRRRSPPAPPPPPLPPPIVPGDPSEILSELRAGMPVVQVAARHGKSQAHVRKTRDNAGIPNLPRGRHPRAK